MAQKNMRKLCSPPGFVKYEIWAPPTLCPPQTNNGPPKILPVAHTKATYLQRVQILAPSRLSQSVCPATPPESTLRRPFSQPQQVNASFPLTGRPAGAGGVTGCEEIPGTICQRSPSPCLNTTGLPVCIDISVFNPRYVLYPLPTAWRSKAEALLAPCVCDVLQLA